MRAKLGISDSLVRLSVGVEVGGRSHRGAAYGAGLNQRYGRGPNRIMRTMRAWISAWMLAMAFWLLPGFAAGCGDEIRSAGAGRGGAGAATEAVTSGSLDSAFEPFNLRGACAGRIPFWLELTASETFPATAIPALIAHKGRHFRSGVCQPCWAEQRRSTRSRRFRQFRASHDAVFVLPDGGLKAGDKLLCPRRSARRGVGGVALHGRAARTNTRDGH